MGWRRGSPLYSILHMGRCRASRRGAGAMQVRLGALELPGPYLSS